MYKEYTFGHKTMRNQELGSGTINFTKETTTSYTRVKPATEKKSLHHKLTNALNRMRMKQKQQPLTQVIQSYKKIFCTVKR